METEPIVCSDCGGESDDPEEELARLGWVLDGEFGPRCWCCVRDNVEPAPEAGVDFIARAIGAKEKRKKEAP